VPNGASAGGAEPFKGSAVVEPFPVATLARFFGGVAVYLLIVNLLMFTDGLLLKRLVAEAAQATGAGEAQAAALANAQEGFYGAAQAIARIPYQLILAVTFIIFPLVSESTFARDAERTRRYVAATMRYSLVVVALLAAVLGARPDAVMRVFYKPEYAVAAPALAVLLAGYVCFSLFNIAGTILNGAGRTRDAMITGAVALASCVGACWAGTAWALATHRDALLWAAISTTAAMALALSLSGVFLFRAFGAFLPMLTILRTALASGAAYGLGRAWPTTGFFGGKLGTLAWMSACGIVFLTVAVASGELRPSEIKRLRKS
jgi:O-antigen/teichoic acid export membrane protein